MNELIDTLVSKLGVSEGQAKGGAALLLNMAKEQLGKADFSKISQAHPGIGDLLKAAPQQEGEGGGGGLLDMVGKLTSSLGGAGGELGQLAGLAGGFEKLGMKAEMLPKFIPIVMGFFEQKGGEAANLLKGVFGGGTPNKGQPASAAQSPVSPVQSAPISAQYEAAPSAPAPSAPVKSDEGTGTIDLGLPKTIDEAADLLYGQGKISNMEAAQLKMWARAKPDKSAGAAKFEAWKKAQPVDVPEIWQLKNNEEAGR